MLDENSREKLVVWSGGLDSTVLLTDIAEKFSTKKNPVLAYSFVVNFLDKNKVVMERRARKAYLRWAKKRGYNIDYQEINISFSDTIPRGGWSQGLFWFSFITPFIPKNCDTYFGYVQGDSIWLAVSSFHKAFTNLCYIGDKESTKLFYPFSYKKKWEIIKKAAEYGIPKECFWTCEEPIKVGRFIQLCKKCDPCRTFQAAKFDFRNRRNGKCSMV